MEQDNPPGRVVFRCHPRWWRRTSGRQPRRGLGNSKNSCYLGCEPQEPPCDGVTDGKLPAPRLRRGPQRGLEPEPRDREAINPVNPADASYALAAQELCPARVRRPRPHRRPADGGGAASRRRAGDRPPGRPGRRARHRRRLAAVRAPTSWTSIEAFVRGGGGLVVLAECDQDKYGNNLQELLGRFGVAVASTTVQEGARRHQNVATWVLADVGATVGQGLLAGVADACFYRAGVLPLDGAPGAQVLAATSRHRRPGRPAAGRGACRSDQGRVVVFADSDLFGDDSIEELDHRTLWTNVVTWAAGPGGTALGDQAADRDVARATAAASATADAVELDEHWLALKDAVTRIRPMQSKDGSIDGQAHDHAEARRLVARDHRRDRRARPALPARRRLPRRPSRPTSRRWADGGFGVPDFLDSLVPFQPAAAPGRRPAAPGRLPDVHPERQPRPQRRGRAASGHLAASGWPSWSATLRQPAVRADHASSTSPPATTPTPRCSSPRPSPCARSRRSPGARIFADREAARFRRVSTRRRADTSACSCPPDADAAGRTTRSCRRAPSCMWDLIHDRTHSHGDLPFDPFMIKQRMPFLLYSLEELRCDLTAFREAVAAGGARACRHARLRAVRRRSSTACSASRSPATGCATTTASAASCSSPGCTSTTSLHWTDNRLSHRLGAAARRRHRPAAPRSRSSTATASTAPKHRALAGRLRAGLALRRRRTRRSAWAKGRDGAAADRAAQGADRRGAARRVPAQHVLRGAAQEAARRHRLHLRHHRVSTADAGAPARSPGGSSSVAGAAGAAGPPLVRPARRPPARPSWPPTPAPSGCEPVVAQGNAAPPAAAPSRRRRGPARRAGHPGLGRRGAGRARPGRRPGPPGRRLARRRAFTETRPGRLGRCCRTCWSARCSTPRAPSTTACRASDDGAAACWSRRSRRRRPDRGQRRLRRGQGRRRGLDPGGGRLVPRPAARRPPRLHPA